MPSNENLIYIIQWFQAEYFADGKWITYSETPEKSIADSVLKSGKPIDPNNPYDKIFRYKIPKSKRRIISINNGETIVIDEMVPSLLRRIYLFLFPS